MTKIVSRRANFKIYIGIGSSLEHTLDYAQGVIETALRALSEISDRPLVKSPMYRSCAFPRDSGPDFLNGVIGIETPLNPETVLSHLHEIEAKAGRVRTKRWGPRVLDLDIIACDDLVLPNPEILLRWINLPLPEQMREIPECLILPHPRMQEREFVLKPLCDIAPEWCHPVLNKRADALYQSLPEALRKSLRRVDFEA